MKITIEADAKEIAALLREIAVRRKIEQGSSNDILVQRVKEFSESPVFCKVRGT